MTEVSWSTRDNDLLFETGLDRGVINVPPNNVFLAGLTIPWVGLVSVDESNETEVATQYIDGLPFLHTPKPRIFEASISAHSFPVEALPLLGIYEIAEGIYIDGQPPVRFNLSYRTLVGHKAPGMGFHYKMHLVYNAVLSSEGISYETIADGSSIAGLNFTLSAVPIHVRNHRSTSHFILDSRTADSNLRKEIEGGLYREDPIFPCSNYVSITPTYSASVISHNPILYLRLGEKNLNFKNYANGTPESNPPVNFNNVGYMHNWWSGVDEWYDHLDDPADGSLNYSYMQGSKFLVNYPAAENVELKSESSTLEGWLGPSLLRVASGATEGRIEVFGRWGATAAERIWRVYLTSSPVSVHMKINLEIQQASGNLIHTTADTVNTNEGRALGDDPLYQMHHYVAVVTPTNIKIYYDSVLKIDYDLPSGKTVPVLASAPIRLSGENDPNLSTSLYSHVSLDEVAFYDYALPYSAIEEHYAIGRVRPTPSRICPEVNPL